MDLTGKLRGYVRRCVVAAVAATVAVALAAAAVALGSTAQAAAGRTLLQSAPSELSGYWWDICRDSGSRTVRILLESNHQCGGTSGVIGWAAITTNSATSHLVEVCDYDAYPAFTLRVEVANPDGSSSGNVIEYPAYYGAGCYKATKGYPIRKFRAGYDYYYYSPWWQPA